MRGFIPGTRKACPVSREDRCLLMQSKMQDRHWEWWQRTLWQRSHHRAVLLAEGLIQKARQTAIQNQK